jgi:hypothetical protein
MDDYGAAALAKGVAEARHTSEDAIKAAKAYVAKFTWKATAAQIRSMLAGLVTKPTFRN